MTNEVTTKIISGKLYRTIKNIHWQYCENTYRVKRFPNGTVVLALETPKKASLHDIYGTAAMNAKFLVGEKVYILYSFPGTWDFLEPLKGTN